MIQSDSIPFAFGNLKEQFSLAAEPGLSVQEQDQLKQASAREDHQSIAKILQPFVAHKKPAVTITHDVDWLDPYHPFAWVQSTVKGLQHKKRLTFAQLSKRDLFLRNCERLLVTEQQNTIQSVWCIGAQATEGLGRYDIRYSAFNPLLKELIALIQQYKQQIGLHSSYNAITKGTLTSELEQLQQLTGTPIAHHRSHYLHAIPEQLYSQLETNGIQYELGWGYARSVALKQGIPTLFRPLNSKTQTLFTFRVTPLVLMDNVFFVKPEQEIYREFESILQSIQTVNGSACLLFHPENFLLKPQLWDSFQQIIDICTQHTIALQRP